jgi:hypothetical protein
MVLVFLAFHEALADLFPFYKWSANSVSIQDSDEKYGLVIVLLKVPLSLSQEA